mgnify:CR=1 FL=1
MARRRAIGGGGGGFAGGLFQGLMASEDTRQKRASEDRALMLTESRIESENVANQQKALKMEIDTDAFNEAKRQRMLQKEVQDFTKSKMFVTDTEQVMSDMGGFVDKEVTRLRDFTGAQGMENFLQAQRDIVNFSLSKGAIPPEKINQVMKLGMDITKQIGQKAFLRNLKNLNTEEAKDLIMKAHGITQYSKADFSASSGAPIITYTDANGKVQKLDIGTQLLDLEILSQVMAVEETKAKIGKLKAEAGFYNTRDEGRKLGQKDKEINLKNLARVDKAVNDFVKANKVDGIKMITQAGLLEADFPFSALENTAQYKTLDDSGKQEFKKTYRSNIKKAVEKQLEDTQVLMNSVGLFALENNLNFNPQGLGNSILSYIKDNESFLQKVQTAYEDTSERAQQLRQQGLVEIDGNIFNDSHIRNINASSTKNRMKETYGSGVYQ